MGADNYKIKIRNYMILTYGCQMNVRDSEAIAAQLDQMGLIETMSINEADFIILNTCSVRHSAENKVYGKLGELKRIKKSRPELKVAVCGCMAQLEEPRRIFKKLGVDLVLGIQSINELPSFIEQIENGAKSIVKVMSQVSNISKLRGRPGISAFVNIMNGCDNFCSYCIVPYTRGREHSRPSLEIIEEIRNLISLGYKEVTLLGQNVNSYGKGLEENITFAELLGKLTEVPGLARVRFMTSHPKDVSKELIAIIAADNNICEHIHIPLQAGSDKILKEMNRGYTQDRYLRLIDEIRRSIPDVAITSDFIVGFPGETENDYAQTLAMINKIRFDAAFIFMYSPRSGTKAFALADQLTKEEKKQRIAKLIDLQYGIAAELNEKLEGSVQEVLVEGLSKTDQSRLTARTRSNRIVNFAGSIDLIGELVNVRIVSSNTFSLIGELLY